MNNYNKIIIGLVILILAFGLSVLYSVTYQRGQLFRDVFLDQLTWAGIGIVVLFLVSNINYRRFFDLAFFIYGLSIVFLLIVLLTGREILGARRWVELFGLNFQPSEIAKLGIVLVLARIFSQRQSYARSYFSGTSFVQELLIPILITLLPVGLIFLQPDLGTALLFIPVFFAMLIVGGAKIKYILSLFILMILSVPVGWHFLKPYQKDRLMVFLNPNVDPLGAGYTVIQSKIAVGSGGFLGKGWLAGTQNQLNFLPERHTDFIFSVIGEEWGFLGAMLLLLLYAALIYYLLLIAFQSKDKFAKYLSSGFIALLVSQIVINISMTIGICPVVGLCLPLISYGGSSMFVFLIFIAILLNINKKRIVF